MLTSYIQQAIVEILIEWLMFIARTYM